MKEHVEQLRGDLQDPEVMPIVLSAALKSCEESWRARGTKRDDGFYSLFSALERSYHAASARVLETSESAIEKMLFNGLLFGCAVSDPFGLLILHEDGDAMAAIEARREHHNNIRAIQQKCRRTWTERTAYPYLDRCLAEGHITQEDCDFWKSEDIGSALYGNAFHVIPQAKLPGKGPKGRSIRADAIVYVPDRPNFLVAIECDGYEWHSNKDAFTADRVRDRTLAAAGCEVVRFSGSEIFRNPNEAARELYGQLCALRDRSPKPRRWSIRAEGR